MKFGHFTLIISLALAAVGAYFSVWGLSQLFAGAATAIIIMASVFEVFKVTATTALHKDWNTMAKGLRTFLMSAVIVFMLITSAGIYGFLSNAFQTTSNKLEIHEGELGVFESKKLLFEKNITDNEKIVTTKNKRIEQLTDLRSRQEVRLDSAKTSRARTQARADIEIATNEIQKLSTEIDVINSKNAALSDSVSSYNGKQLQLKSGSKMAGEVGPLKYIAELTGVPMNRVVNYLILLIIFVFDPSAIALLLYSNMKLKQYKKDEEPKKDATKEVLESIVEKLKDAGVDDKDGVLSERINDNVELLVEPEDRYDSADLVTLPTVIEEEPVIETPVVEETAIVSEKEIEVPVYKKEPVIPTGKIELEDIKEIKENRGYSKPIPTAKSNTIQRVGTNKVIKNGDNDKLFFKRK